MFSLDKMCLVRGCRARAPPTSSVANRDSRLLAIATERLRAAAAAGALALFVASATFVDQMENCCAMAKYWPHSRTNAAG